MPADPNECRRHAANCKHLAKTAATSEVKSHLIKLAAQWERIAGDLERAEAVRCKQLATLKDRSA